MWWSFGEKPLWLDFGNPTIMNLGNKTWDPDYVVIEEDHKDDWVYLVITAPTTNQTQYAQRSFVSVAHPVSLVDFCSIVAGRLLTPIRSTSTATTLPFLPRAMTRLW